MPELEAGGDAVAFDKFVAAMVEGDAELSAKAQQGVYITTTNEADKEYVEIANGKIKGLKETTSPITLAATFPGSDADNLNASNTLQFSVKVVPLKKVEALLELDAMPERISVGESFKVTFTVEPDEAADHAVVKTADESIKAEKKEGVWTLTGVSVNDSAVYTVNFPEDSKYSLEAPEEGVIEVIPGAVISTPAADEQSKITIKRGESVTFASAGADKLLIEDADGNTETVSNPYTYPFDKSGEYMITVTPGYGDKVYADNNGTNYGISAIYKIVVEANPLCGEVVFSHTENEIAADGVVTLTCENADKIAYSVNGGKTVIAAANEANVTVSEDCIIEAWGINADEVAGKHSAKHYTILQLISENGDFTFDFVNNEYGMKRYSGTTNEYNSDPYTVYNDDVNKILSIKVENGTNGKNRLWADGWRFFRGSKIGNTSNYNPCSYIVTFSITDGYAITGIDLDGAITDQTITSEDNLYSNKSWKGSSNKVVFTFTTDSNVALATAKITYTHATAKAHPGIYPDQELYTYYLHGNETVELPGFSGLDRFEKDQVKFTSSNPAVAKVDENGSVSANHIGKAIITASFAGDDTYKAVNAKYIVNVGLEDVSDKEETFIPVPAIYDEGDAIQKGNDFSIQDSDFILVEHQPGVTIHYEYVAGSNSGNESDKPLQSAPARVAQNETSDMHDNVSTDDRSAIKIYPYGKKSAGYNHWTDGTITVYAEDANGNRSATRTINIGTPTSVEGIEAEGNGEVEYFNLQGVKVQNPEKGIYIRVQDGNAVKMVK